jgi:hypothetical protein
MKKTAVLLAGLLLVTGTVFAEGWEVTGAAVEGTLNIIDTQNGMDMTDGDVDLVIKTTKEVKEGASAYVELNFENESESNSDIGFGFSVTEGDFFATIGAKLELTSNEVGTWDHDNDTKTKEITLSSSSKLKLVTKDGDSTYLGWYVMGNKDMKLTVYPYEVAGMSWDNDTWESFTGNGSEGFAFAYTVAEGTTVTAKWAMFENANAVNHDAFKFELATKVAGASVDAYFATRPENTDAKVKADTAMGAKASMPMGDLTVSGEFNTETIDDGDAKTGLFAKVAYAMGDINGYATTPYASFKTLNEYVDTAAGATTETEAGVTLAQGSFSVKPKVVIKTAENKKFKQEDDTDTDTATTAGITFAYSM